MIYPTGKSLEWVGGTGSDATLDVQIEPLLIEKEQELIIDKDGNLHVAGAVMQSIDIDAVFLE